MSKRKKQCDQCQHNNGVRCESNKPQYYNNQHCDARKIKWPTRIKVLNSTSDKTPVFYSDMER